jgi:hypothetical protein
VAFECIAIGIARNLDSIKSRKDEKDFVKTRIEDFWKHQDIGRFTVAGMRGTTRIQKTLPFGKTWFE